MTHIFRKHARKIHSDYLTGSSHYGPIIQSQPLRLISQTVVVFLCKKQDCKAKRQQTPGQELKTEISGPETQTGFPQWNSKTLCCNLNYTSIPGQINTI